MTPLDKLRAEMEELKHYHRSCGCSGVIEDLADRLLKAAEWISSDGMTYRACDTADRILRELAGEGK